MFTLNIRQLKAAALFASKDKTRVNITCVCVERNHIVATDVHRLIKFDIVTEGNFEPFTIPRDFLDKITISKNCDECQVMKKGDIIVIEYAGNIYKMQETGIIYPDWRRVIPQTQEHVGVIGFNAAYVGDLVKIHKTLGKKEAHIDMEFYGEEKPMLIKGRGCDYTAVLMPTRKPKK